jgi:hypothetical protein
MARMLPRLCENATADRDAAQRIRRIHRVVALQGAAVVEATHVFEESAVDIDEQDLENRNRVHHEEAAQADHTGPSHKVRDLRGLWLGVRQRCLHLWWCGCALSEM